VKTAFITGGTGGIGTAIVKEFIENNYFVIVTHRNKSKRDLDNWLKINLLPKEHILLISCDLTRRREVFSCASSVLKDFNIDVLVNNAGITADSTFLKMTEDSWREVIETNLISLFSITQLIATQMVERKQGSIINISSINALKGQFGQTNYAASKAGIIGFTKSLAQELAIKGVKVNAIAPGYTLTPMIDKISDKIKDNIKNNIPTGDFVRPEEIAKAVLFMSSELNSLTGETLSINGGQYMQ